MGVPATLHSTLHLWIENDKIQQCTSCSSSFSVTFYYEWLLVMLQDKLFLPYLITSSFSSGNLKFWHRPIWVSPFLNTWIFLIICKLVLVMDIAEIKVFSFKTQVMVWCFARTSDYQQYSIIRYSNKWSWLYSFNDNQSNQSIFLIKIILWIHLD